MTQEHPSLVAYEAALYRVCFSAIPPEAAVAGMALPRLRLYRSMVRSRLYNHIKAILPTATAASEAPLLENVFTSWLSTSPPRSPLFRDVPTRFATYILETGARVRTSDQSEVLDRFRWETAKWEASHRPRTTHDGGSTQSGQETNALEPFAFDRVARLHGSVQVLDLRHTVFRDPVQAGPVSVCVYRRESDQRVYTWELGALAKTLLTVIQREPQWLFQQVVRETAALVGRPVEESFVAELADLLAQLDDRGILLGSVAPAGV